MDSIPPATELGVDFAREKSRIAAGDIYVVILMPQETIEHPYELIENLYFVEQQIILPVILNQILYVEKEFPIIHHFLIALLYYRRLIRQIFVEQRYVFVVIKSELDNVILRNSLFLG